jgi:hypothetical protein
MDPDLAEHLASVASDYPRALEARILAFARTLAPAQVAEFLAIVEAADNAGAAAILRQEAPDPRAQVAQEVAGANLEHAAAQFVTAVEGVPTGDSTQEQLRARRAALDAAALAYAAAHGWQSPPPT